MIRLLSLTACLLVAACGQRPVLFAAPAAVLTAPGLAEPGARIAVPYRTIEVRQVTLPSYADRESIFREGADGTLTPVPGAEWADLPDRALTLDLVSVLEAVTGARVAAEPWPFDRSPEARVEIRATRLAAGADGFFRLSGQYHVADLRLDVETPRDRSGRFDVAVPYDPALSAMAIADARSRAVRDLARLVASNGM